MNEQELKKLWQTYAKSKDAGIKETLIVEYAPVVKFVAGRLSIYLGNNVEFDDLVGYGVFGLIDAIDKFDVNKGIKFETYASLRIRGAIFDHIRKMDWVPRSVRKKQKLMDAATQKLELEHGVDIEAKHMAKELDISLEEYYKWEEQTKSLMITSLEEHVDKGGETKIESIGKSRFQSPEEGIEREEIKKTLIKAINDLSEKEKMVITLYYYEELTLREISEILEVSESRISQLHTKALKKMKKFLGDDVTMLASI